MSVYNNSQYLSDCIESILSQSEGNFEFIIINDGSTDETPDVLDSYSDARLVILHQNNTGLTKSLNRGLRMAKGKYIARIDADDQALQDRFKKQNKFLEKNTNIALVGSNALLIDDSGKNIGKTKLPLSHNELVTKLEALKPAFVHSSIFFRRETIEKMGGYNERFTKTQDYDLYLRLSQSYNLANLEDPHVKLRLSVNSLSHSSDNLQKKMGLAAIINHYRRKKGLEDFTVSTEGQWNFFLDELEIWFKDKRFDKKTEAKKWFRDFRSLMKRKKIYSALKSLFLAFRNDLFFLTYKDIGIKIPTDIERFMAK